SQENCCLQPVPKVSSILILSSTSPLPIARLSPLHALSSPIPQPDKLSPPDPTSHGRHQAHRRDEKVRGPRSSLPFAEALPLQDAPPPLSPQDAPPPAFPLQMRRCPCLSKMHRRRPSLSNAAPGRSCLSLFFSLPSLISRAPSLLLCRFMAWPGKVRSAAEASSLDFLVSSICGWLPPGSSPCHGKQAPVSSSFRLQAMGSVSTSSTQGSITNPRTAFSQIQELPFLKL
ncbi:unnamed protein product, partial [Urochloa humidicola]